MQERQLGDINRQLKHKVKKLFTHYYSYLNCTHRTPRTASTFLFLFNCWLCFLPSLQLDAEGSNSNNYRTMQQITWAAGTVVDEGAAAYHMQQQQHPNHSAAMDCEPTLQIGYLRAPCIQLFDLPCMELN